MRAIPRAARTAASGIPSAVATMGTWPARRWAVAALAALVAALLIGIPTGIVHTSFYTRMTEVLWWNYPVWAISAVLVGLTAATYVRGSSSGSEAGLQPSRTVGATLLATFAVGCPVCNKLVVGLIGVTGALNYWAPLQPILGVLSVALLATGLIVRLRGAAACAVLPSG